MCEKVPRDVTHSLGVLVCASQSNICTVTRQCEALPAPAQELHLSFLVGIDQQIHGCILLHLFSLPASVRSSPWDTGLIT